MMIERHLHRKGWFKKLWFYRITFGFTGLQFKKTPSYGNYKGKLLILSYDFRF